MRDDCENCGLHDTMLLNEKRNGVDAVICRNCGLVWNRLMLDESAQVEFYKHEYRSKIRISRRYLGSMLARAANVVEFLQPELKAGMRHLDIGCAEGTLLALTRAQGMEVAGMEVDEQFSHFAREVRQLPVAMTTLQNAAAPEKPFDLVSFVHVVEHLYHPVETLRLAAEQLGEGGLLFIEVPNIERPPVGPRQFFCNVHNFYFSPNTLRSLVAKAGFTPLRVGASRRDGSLQLLARKSSVTEAALQANQPPQWRDNAAHVMQRIKTYRMMYYPTLRFITRKIRKRLLVRETLRRYSASLKELKFYEGL